MVRDALETQELRRDTAEFISADGDEFVIKRHSRQSDGAGGWTQEPQGDLDPQTLRFQPTVSRESAERTTLAGVVVSPQYELIGMHDADLQRGDTFTFEGHQYEVVFVDDTSDYRTVAEVVRGGS